MISDLISPLELTVKMRITGTPTLRYASTSCAMEIGGHERETRHDHARSQPEPRALVGSYGLAVPESGVERVAALEQAHDVCQDGNLELLRPPLDHLPAKPNTAPQARH